MNIVIDKQAETPVYRQIIEQITRLVKAGVLKPGDKLPPERELAIELGTARGTVKQAYANLAAGRIVEIIHGRGTFISPEQDVLATGRKERAVKLIGNVLSSLERLNFSHREIGTMFHLLLAERRQRLAGFRIAAVDCNPEALSIFETQLRHLTHVSLHKFLLDELLSDSDARKRLAQYELILTTSTHYGELLSIMPGERGKLIRAVVSPSQQTIIDLATLPASARIGIITRSGNFLGIIRRRLKEFHIASRETTALFETERERLAEFLESRNVLITPPKCALESDPACVQPFRKFLERGGRIIRFEYQLERGALITIEEKISELMEQTGAIASDGTGL